MAYTIAEYGKFLEIQPVIIIKILNVCGLNS